MQRAQISAPWWPAAQRLLRSSAVGIVATAADFAVLEVLVRGVHLEPAVAKVPALALGLCVQFFGNRSFTFGGNRGGSMRRQLAWFAVTEVAAFWLTVLVFQVLLRGLRAPLEVANALAGSIVYFGFSYPMWNRVFRERVSG